MFKHQIVLTGCPIKNLSVSDDFIDSEELRICCPKYRKNHILDIDTAKLEGIDLILLSPFHAGMQIALITLSSF